MTTKKSDVVRGFSLVPSLPPHDPEGHITIGNSIIVVGLENPEAFCVPGGTRTRNPLLRRQPLYPLELQGRL